MMAASSQITHEHNTPLYAYTVHQHTPLAPLQPTTMQMNAISLVKKDIRMTALISTTILAIQLLLFFLLKNHILAIGFVRY